MWRIFKHALDSKDTLASRISTWNTTKNLRTFPKRNQNQVKTYANINNEMLKIQTPVLENTPNSVASEYMLLNMQANMIEEH